MSSLRPVHVPLALALAALTSSCVFSIGGGGSRPSSDKPLAVAADGAKSAKPAADAKPATDAKAAEAAADPKAAETKAAEAKERARARKLEKRAHDLGVAKSELEIAELESKSEEHEAQVALDEARRSLGEAQTALAHFVERKLPQQLADARLDLDRSTQNKLEAEQELREMEATFEKDQFARDTKELVLARHRKRVEFSTRSLALAEQRFADREQVDLPRERRELERKVRDAEQKVREAEVKQRKTRMANEVELTKKRFQVSELERPLEDDEGGADGKKGS
jgi:hypothetical protein